MTDSFTAIIGLHWGNRRWFTRTSGWPTSRLAATRDALTLRSLPFGPRFEFARREVERLRVRRIGPFVVLAVEHNRAGVPRVLRVSAPTYARLDARLRDLGWPVEPT